SSLSYFHQSRSKPSYYRSPVGHHYHHHHHQQSLTTGFHQPNLFSGSSIPFPPDFADVFPPLFAGDGGPSSSSNPSTSRSVSLAPASYNTPPTPSSQTDLPSSLVQPQLTSPSVAPTRLPPSSSLAESSFMSD